MQRCKSERSSCAKVQKWETEIHFQVSGLGSRVSGTGYRVRVRGAGPEPVPGAEHLNQIPEGRDLGPENDFVPADAMSSHPYQAADLDAHTADIGHIHGLRIEWWVS